jgi:hypothetical protein
MLNIIFLPNLGSPHTADFQSADSSVGLLMYGSVHITAIRNRPTKKVDGLPDCLQTKESENSQYG